MYLLGQDTGPANGNVNSGSNANSAANINSETNTNVFSNTNSTPNTNNAGTTNGSTNTNSPTNVNANTGPFNSNGTGNNSNTASNSNIETTGWQTYDSSTSALVAFRSIEPAYKVSYPRSWTIDEELGGLYLSENGHANLEPSINIWWADQELSGDPIEDCKRFHGWGSSDDPIPSFVNFDKQLALTVDGRTSALVSYYLESDNLDDEGDKTVVCVPAAGKTMIIQAQPRSSNFAVNYFDAVLATIDIAE